MKSFFKKNVNTIIIIVLLLIVFCISIGYATFAKNIKSISNNNNANWNISITDIKTIDKSNGAKNITDPKVTSSSSAIINCYLNSIGDYIMYEVTIENNGTMDAYISDVIISPLDSNFKYTVSNLKTNQVLNHKGFSTHNTAKVKIKIYYDNNQNLENINHNFSVIFVYKQK